MSIMCITSAVPGDVEVRVLVLRGVLAAGGDPVAWLDAHGAAGRTSG